MKPKAPRSEEPESRQLLVRFSRGADGRLIHSLPYAYRRDDALLLAAKPIAFDVDLSKLDPERRALYVACEESYGDFYQMWRGSGNLECAVSRQMDRLQAELERLRSVLNLSLQNVLAPQG